MLFSRAKWVCHTSGMWNEKTTYSLESLPAKFTVFRLAPFVWILCTFVKKIYNIYIYIYVYRSKVIQVSESRRWTEYWLLGRQSSLMSTLWKLNRDNLITCTFGTFTGSSLYHWKSMHRDCKYDRIHHFKCIYGFCLVSSCSCAWSTHYENDYDQPLRFTCPHNGVITGVVSEYSETHHDRR